MLQSEFLANLRRVAVESKEQACKRRPTDMTSFIVAHRGEDPIAQVMISEGNRHNIMDVFHQVAAGLDADAMGLVTESYIPGIDPATGEVYQHNPMTGEGWGYSGTGRGGMQALAEDHDGLAKGWICECIAISAVNRAGDLGFISLPYKYVGGKHLYWREDLETSWSTIDAEREAGGFMFEVMREIMAAPSVTQKMPDIDLSREQKDILVAKHLTAKKNAVVLFAPVGTERAEVISEVGIIVQPFPEE